MIGPVSLIPAIIALLTAMFTVYLISRPFPVTNGAGRNGSIDGLRGYLAFFVFLHHSSIWYFYLRTDEWHVPPSNIYTNFGHASVALFFMITGFLFFSKLLDAKTKGIDWTRLYISRFLRIAPLYYFVIFMLFMIVIVLSKGILHVPMIKIVTSTIRWLAFTIMGAPNINGIEHTASIVSEVTWTLAYEWMFYLSLPLLALTVRIKPPPVMIIISLACTLGLPIIIHPHFYSILSFAGGITASFLVRSAKFRQIAIGNYSSLLVIACVGFTSVWFPSVNGVLPLILLSCAFALIAAGNSIFGILVTPVSKALGEMAYSIYLLHGMTLFVVFTFVIGVDRAKYFSPAEHWILVIAVSAILMIISAVSFRFIERPAMQATDKIKVLLFSILKVKQSA